VELRENFSEDEFENAIIGTWRSAFEWEDNVNVIFLKIDCENKAEIHIDEDGLMESYLGDLSIEYPRPTSPTRTTRAKLIIKTTSEEIVLSDVGFGKNNMISAENLYLRNYDSPQSTLEWAEE
jgi:hypothetical protein